MNKKIQFHSIWFNAIEILESYFVDINIDSKFTWQGKRPRIPNTILKKTNKVGEF